MDGPQDPGVREIFREFAQGIQLAADIDEVHGVLVRYAVRLIGCDHAAISVLQGGRMRTAAASDPVAAVLDDFQRQTGEGPCLDAVTEAGWEHHAEIVADGDSAFQRLVRARTPVRSMLAFRLMDDADKRGALNLFSDRAGAFQGWVAEQAAILAAFATVAAASARHSERSAQLAAALDSNRQIATAIGILMASRRLTAEEALHRLRRASQSLNRKLRDVAAQVVVAHERGLSGAPSPDLASTGEVGGAHATDE